MKFAIISDIHYGEGEELGKINPETRLNTRLEDIHKAFNTYVDYVTNEENGIDIAVIAGDIYKSRKPSSTQKRLFTRALLRILKANKKREIPRKVIVFPGNHDLQLAEDAHTISDLSEVISIYDENLTVVDDPTHFLLGEQDEVLLVTIPYLYRQKLNLGNNEQVVQYYKQAIDRSLAVGARAKVKILIGHQTAEGASLLEYKDINSFNEIVIPKEMLGQLDAAFFGHIHKYQVLNEANPLIVNQGNPVTLTFGEVEEKGFVVYDTESKRHKRVLIASTPFVKIKIDSSQSAVDATTLIVKELTSRLSELTGSIVKIFATIKEEDLPLRTAEIKVLLQDVQFYAGIEKTIIRKERARSKEVTKFASPNAILIAVAKAKKLSAEDAEEYLQLGMEIVAKTVVELGNEK